MAISKNPNAKTVDGIAAKVAYPTLALGIVGIILAVLDLSGLVDIEDEIWLTLIGSALGVLGIGYKSPPALLASDVPVVDRRVA